MNCSVGSECHVGLSFVLPWVVGFCYVVLDEVVESGPYKDQLFKMLVLIFSAVFVCIGCSGFLFGKAYDWFGIHNSAASGYILVTGMLFLYYEKSRNLLKKK